MSGDRWRATVGFGGAPAVLGRRRFPNRTEVRGGGIANAILFEDFAGRFISSERLNTIVSWVSTPALANLKADLLVPGITQYLHQVTQILDSDIVDFGEHGTIRIIVALSDSMRKQGRGNHDELFIFEHRLVVTPGNQRAWPPVP